MYHGAIYSLMDKSARSIYKRMKRRTCEPSFFWWNSARAKCWPEFLYLALTFLNCFRVTSIPKFAKTPVLSLNLPACSLHNISCCHPFRFCSKYPYPIQNRRNPSHLSLSLSISLNPGSFSHGHKLQNLNKGYLLGMTSKKINWMTYPKPLPLNIPISTILLP